MVNFKDLLIEDVGADGVGRIRKIDKNGRFYHVVQRAANRDNIYDKEIANYRENRLCKICAMYNVVIVFSVVMTNHTHDVLMAENWELIAQVLKLVNSAVARKVRKRNSKKYAYGRNVFEETPFYRAIHDVIALMVVGKYVFDNANSVELKGGFVPYSCFSFLKKGYVIKPYNKNLYPMIFGLSELELCTLYAQNDLAQIQEIAKSRFKNWTQHDNDLLFKADISVPWLPDTETLRL